ncbi:MULTISPECIES: hypothetical protein [unclassified Frankia]|uniref:hypothetical protein n=1 Tax=unclassified Frankia TaxID=2632575 RepID=UPI001EF5FA67|nr:MULTISPECIES: hypothetical protein [unclassified Frankia]
MPAKPCPRHMYRTGVVYQPLHWPMFAACHPAKLTNPTRLEYWERAWLARFRALYAAHRDLSTAWAAVRDSPGLDWTPTPG